VSAMLTQPFVALNDRAIGQRYLLHVAIILFVNEPIHLGDRPIGLAAFPPLNLDGPALASRQSSSAWVMSEGESEPKYLAWPWVLGQQDNAASWALAGPVA